MDNIKRVAGGTGCDVVDADVYGNREFNARRGKIYAIVVREDNTQIASVVEYDAATNTSNRVTNRSWIGGDTESSGGDSTEGFPTLLQNDLLIPDYPLTSIHVMAGSVMVYYEEYGWKHYRR